MKNELLLVENHFLQSAMVNASLPSKLCVGIIALIHKKGKPVDEMKGYRPISLLNTHLKILTKILSNRFKSFFLQLSS